jgi:hypothetical protein
MSKTTFSGPIRTGRDPGYSAARSIGYVPVTQQVRFSAGTIDYVVLPPASRVVDIRTVVFTALSGAPGADVRVETSAGLQFANFSISAKGVYEADAATVSAPAWLSAVPDGSPLAVVIDVTAPTSSAAAEHLFGMVNLTYLQRF